MIKKIALFLCLFTLRCLAQTGYTTVTGTHLTDSTGTPISNASVTFAPVSATGTPIAYQVNGNGQSTFANVQAQVTAGTFTSRIADTNLTKPQNVCFSVTVTDNASGEVLLGALGYTCVQPQWNNYWCVAGACNFDQYQPNLASLAVIQTGPQGSAGPACSTGSGVCNMTVPIVLPGDPALPSEAANMNFVNESAGLNVTTVFGSDIGAKVNNAIIACASACNLHVPAGTYNYSTTIVLPLNTFGQLNLTLDPGATLAYTGSGIAIDTAIGTAGPGPVSLVISGGRLIGTSAATEGIHILPSQRVTIEKMLIEGFSNGDGVWLEGPDSMNVLNNNIQNNLNGVRLSPTFCTASYPFTCGPTVSGSAWSPNLINVRFNQIADNLHWGIFEDRNGVSGGGWTGSLHNTYEDNDLEINGSCVGCTQYGAIYIGKSTVDTVRNNYFEVSERQIVLGELGAGAFFAANSPIIRDNFFTTRTLTPYNIELQNTVGALIDGNSEQVQTANSSNCFVNSATGGESQTYIGHNLYFQNTGGLTGNPLCVNGSLVGQLPGAGSFNLVNSTFQTYIANGQFITTASVASEMVVLQNVSAGSYCFVTPANAGAAGVWSVNTFFVVAVAGGVTYTHPTTAGGVRVNIFCSTT